MGKSFSEEEVRKMDIGVENRDGVALTEALTALEDMKLQKQWVVAEMAAEQRAFEIVKNKNRMLKPEFEYQELPEYWENQRELMRIAVEKKLFELRAALVRIEKALRVREEEVDRIRNQG